MGKNIKVGILTMEKFNQRKKGTIGSSIIRGEWVANNWDEAEIYVCGRQYEAIIYQKAYWKTGMENFKGIQIFDLCDPDHLDGSPVVETMELCDAMTVPTEALKQELSKYIDKPIYVIPDRIDFAEIKAVKPTNNHSQNLKRVAWFGYYHNADVLDLTLEELKFYDLELHIYSDGNYNPSGFYNFRNHVYNANTIHEELIQYDAIILPQKENNLRFSMKSNNKTILAQALGLPVIKTPEDIDNLKSKEARESEAEKMLNYVKSEYDVKKSVEQYKDLIKTLHE